MLWPPLHSSVSSLRMLRRLSPFEWLLGHHSLLGGLVNPWGCSVVSPVCTVLSVLALMKMTSIFRTTISSHSTTHWLEQQRLSPNYFKCYLFTFFWPFDLARYEYSWNPSSQLMYLFWGSYCRDCTCPAYTSTLGIISLLRLCPPDGKVMVITC